MSERMSKEFRRNNGNNPRARLHYLSQDLIDRIKQDAEHMPSPFDIYAVIQVNGIDRYYAAIMHNGVMHFADTHAPTLPDALLAAYIQVL